MDPKDLEFEETLADSELLLKNTARSMDEDAEFTLESILAEYGSGTPAAPEPEGKEPEPPAEKKPPAKVVPLPKKAEAAKKTVDETADETARIPVIPFPGAKKADRSRAGRENGRGNRRRTAAGRRAQVHELAGHPGPDRAGGALRARGHDHRGGAAAPRFVLPPQDARHRAALRRRGGGRGRGRSVRRARTRAPRAAADRNALRLPRPAFGRDEGAPWGGYFHAFAVRHGGAGAFFHPAGGVHR